MCARLRHPREAGVHASLDSLPRLREGRLFAGMTGTVSLAQPGECCGVPGIVSQKKLGIGIIVDGTGRERAAMGDGLTTEPLDFRPRWRKTARAELPYVLRAEFEGPGDVRSPAPGRGGVRTPPQSYYTMTVGLQPSHPVLFLGKSWASGSGPCFPGTNRAVSAS
jgi:hypothetical protein